MKGKLISFEGLDGSGKTVTSLTVQELLEKQGKVVKYISFPQYNSSFFGPILQSVLYSTNTPVVDVDPKLLTFLFAGDRFEAKDKIREWLDAGHIVIANRYVTSNIAYGMAKSENQEEFKTFNEKFEYETCGIPKPDIVIYLDTPLEEIKNRLKCKNQDGYEKDFAFLEKVRNCYIKLVEQCSEWKNVKTNDATGKIMEPTEIASIIIDKYL